MNHDRARLGSRRSVLREAAALAAAPWIVPACALGGAPDAAAPSERITLGFIGVGGMGRGHLHEHLREPGAQVLAVCDVDSWRRESAREMADAAYAERRGGASYRACTAYRDLRELLARDDIDAVVIATGDRWHALATIMAAESGKDTYTEKPASLTIEEALAMIAAVRRRERVGQIGLQQRSAREYQLACRLVREGVLGKIQTVYIPFPGACTGNELPPEPIPEGLDWDLWLGPAPWRPFNGRLHEYGPPKSAAPWSYFRDLGGGNLTTNAVHSIDSVQQALGMDGSGPTEIVPPGVGGQADLTYTYPGGTVLKVVDHRLDSAKHPIPEGWAEGTRLENFGALFVGERGWIHVGRNGVFQASPAELAVQAPPPESHGIAVRDHRRDWYEAIRTRRRPVCDVAFGCGSTIVAQVGCIAHWTGRALRWDPAAHEFLGDDEANRLRHRAMRAPWCL